MPRNTLPTDTINGRIREIFYGLKPKESMEAFGARFGVSRDVIANVLYDRNEASDMLRRLICREFNVNLYWLETGQGEKYVESSADLYDLVDEFFASESPLMQRALRRLLENPALWPKVEQFLHSITEEEKKE